MNRKKSDLFLLLFVLLLGLLLPGCSNNNNYPTGITESPSPQTSEPSETISLPEPSWDVTPAPISSDPLTPPISQADEMLRHAPYQIGDHNGDIALIQNMLIELGFDPGEADGVYGEQLSQAFRNFQLYIGIDVDGIAGQQTLSALVERYDSAITTYNTSENPLKGLKIGIDPGHQRHANDDLEPVMPNNQVLKQKVSSGTTGSFTGVPEYVVNLQVGLKLKKNLETLGAEVIMARTIHDVNISNAERAEIMNGADVDCWIRIHANGTDNPDLHGMFILVPKEGYMNTNSDSVQENSVTLAKAILSQTVKATGAKDLGIKKRMDQSGFGWSSVPVCNIEMGHMTNKEEDYLLVTESYQNKIADGICKGFLKYFNQTI